MPAAGLPLSVHSSYVYPTVELLRRTHLWRSYFPSILTTLLGVITLSLSWVHLVDSAPAAPWFIAMSIIQVAWLVSLSEVWIQNTYLVLRKEIFTAADYPMPDSPPQTQNLPIVSRH
ncbi:hypothetical protein [Terriglobus tenax]|uniref:hypothetical protein n=1 Tax=Terriglobus tenax TaxID=1111115 RepID=UPI0021E05D43|nr:hypothetical protein [Terriglobus tenax]